MIYTFYMDATFTHYDLFANFAFFRLLTPLRFREFRIFLAVWNV